MIRTILIYYLLEKCIDLFFNKLEITLTPLSDAYPMHKLIKNLKQCFSTYSKTSVIILNDINLYRLAGICCKIDKSLSDAYIPQMAEMIRNFFVSHSDKNGNGRFCNVTYFISKNEKISYISSSNSMLNLFFFENSHLKINTTKKDRIS